MNKPPKKVAPNDVIKHINNMPNPDDMDDWFAELERLAEASGLSQPSQIPDDITITFNDGSTIKTGK